MKFLICGSRNWKNEKLLRKRVLSILGPGNHTIINGACKGADLMSSSLAMDQEWKLVEVPANWNKHGKKAGPLRNHQMIIENPDLDGVIAFTNNIKGSKGTKDMIFQANKHGIPVVLIADREEVHQKEQESQLSLRSSEEDPEWIREATYKGVVPTLDKD